MGGSILVLRFTWAPKDMPIMPGLHADYLYYYSAIPYDIPFLATATAHIVEHYLEGESPSHIDKPGETLRAVELLGGLTEGADSEARIIRHVSGDPGNMLSTVGLTLTGGFPAHTLWCGVRAAGRGRLVLVGLDYLEAIFRDPADIHVVRMSRVPGENKVYMTVVSQDYERELVRAYARLEHLFTRLP